MEKASLSGMGILLLAQLIKQQDGEENVQEPSTEEYPAWVQPTGAHDAYPQGAKVSYNGKKWVSTVSGNVWAPGVYGWEEVA